MAIFEELTFDELNDFSVEASRLQHFYLRIAEQLANHCEGNVTLTVYNDDPWKTLNGFNTAGWKYVPAVSVETYTKGHLVWNGIGSPNYMDLSDALHHHFRNSL